MLAQLLTLTPAQTFNLAVTIDDPSPPSCHGSTTSLASSAAPPTSGMLLASEAVSTLLRETLDIPATILRLGINYVHGKQLRLRYLTDETVQRTADALKGSDTNAAKMGFNVMSEEDVWECLAAFVAHCGDMVAEGRRRWQEAKLKIKNETKTEEMKEEKGVLRKRKRKLREFETEKGDEDVALPTPKSAKKGSKWLWGKISP
jgi:hypothetical protein